MVSVTTVGLSCGVRWNPLALVIPAYLNSSSGEGRNPEEGLWVAPIDTRTLSNNQHPHFSYLGVPAPAGMSDWYESMSRTPIRDVPAPLNLAG